MGLSVENPRNETIHSSGAGENGLCDIYRVDSQRIALR